MHTPRRSTGVCACCWGWGDRSRSGGGQGSARRASGLRSHHVSPEGPLYVDRAKVRKTDTSRHLANDLEKVGKFKPNRLWL